MSYADNQQGFDEVRASLSALAEQLAVGNDQGNLSEAEREEGRREVSTLSHAFDGEAIRTGWLLALAKNCLKWISDRAAESTIGDLALRAFDVIIKWFGS